jgi:endonuclease/exonuclease/phosphatase family metal-dependent hydrolase
MQKNNLRKSNRENQRQMLVDRKFSANCKAYHNKTHQTKATYSDHIPVLFTIKSKHPFKI